MMRTDRIAYVPAPRKKTLREWLRTKWDEAKPHSTRDTVAMLVILELIGIAVILGTVFSITPPA